MTWIYAIPAWLFMSSAVIGSCLLACGLLAVTRKRLTRNEQIAHNDVAGPVLTIIGTVLAVMMSFMAVGVWQEYDSATQMAQREASALSDLYHTAVAFPEPLRTNVQRAVREYVTVVIDDEWPLMARGDESARADRLAYAIGAMVGNAKFGTPGESSLKDDALQYVEKFWDARRDRVLANRQGIPLILWAAMLFIGFVTVAFSFYFRVDNARAQYVMVIAVTAVVTIMFTLIAELDYPFRGDIAVSPGSFVHVVEQIQGTLPNAR